MTYILDSDYDTLVDSARDYGSDINLSGKQIRAEKILETLSGAPVKGRAARYRFIDARVVGSLDLSGVTIAHSVQFHSCVFDNPTDNANIVLRDATTNFFLLHDCHALRGIAANRMRAKASFCLRNPPNNPNARKLGPILLEDAQIDGTLDCADVCVDQFGLNATNIRIGNNLRLRKARIIGSIIIDSARIDGSLLAEGININARSIAISATNCTVGGDWLMSTFTGRETKVKTEIVGFVNLRAATVKGRFFANEIVLRNEPEQRIGEGLCVDAEGLKLNSSLSITEAVLVGGARFRNARVGGLASFRATEIKRPRLLPQESTSKPFTALDFEDADLSGGLIYKAGICNGELRLQRARAGDIALNGIRITAGDLGQLALNAQSIESGHWDLSNGRFSGAVEFEGARIKGHLIAGGARFIAVAGAALNLDDSIIDKGLCLAHARVRGAFLISSSRLGRTFDATYGEFDGMVCEGTYIGHDVDVSHATFHTTLSMDQSEVNNEFIARGTQFRSHDDALTLRNATIKGNMIVLAHRDSSAPVFNGRFVLRGALLEGAVRIEDATITSSGRKAFDAQGAIFKDGLDLRRLRIRGRLVCSDARLVGGMQITEVDVADAGVMSFEAIEASFDTVDIKECTMVGAISLAHSLATGRVAICHNKIASASASEVAIKHLRRDSTQDIAHYARVAISLEGSQSRSLHLTASTAECRPNGTIILSKARTSSFEDNAMAWSVMSLEDFNYEMLVNPSGNAAPLETLSRNAGNEIVAARTRWLGGGNPSAPLARLRSISFLIGCAVTSVMFALAVANPTLSADFVHLAVVAAWSPWIVLRLIKSPPIPHFEPQPWSQLANVLSRQGYRVAADKLYAQGRRYQDRSDGGVWHYIGRFLDRTSSYGTDPLKAATSLVLTYLIFALAWTFAGTLCKKPGCQDQTVFQHSAKMDFNAGEYPNFSGWVYSLELIVPRWNYRTAWRPRPELYAELPSASRIVDVFRYYINIFRAFLGIEDAKTMPFAQPISPSAGAGLTFPFGQVFYMLFWLESLIGAVLVAIFFIAVTGLLRQRSR